MFKVISRIAGASPILSAVYLACSPRFGERLYHPDLFQPLYSPDGDYDHAVFSNNTYRDVFFSSKNGKKLHGLFFPVAGAKKTILCSHGNKGNLFDISRLIQLLLDTGNNVFVYDYQGYGRSQGSPTVRRVCEDAIAAFDWLVKEEKIDSQDIILYGESLGAGISCHVAKQREVAGLILQSAFTNIRDIAIESIPLLQAYPEWLFPRPFLDNEKVLAEVRKPVLILHGTFDKDVPFTHAKKLFAHANGTKMLVELPNTLHEDIALEDNDVFAKAAREFFANLTKRETVATS
jgi:alpha-beta hydrolase superfamily lysophospholipase